VNHRSVIQIVPRRTDQPDGVGDYATLLARALFQQKGWVSTFVPGTPAGVEPPIRDAWRTVPVTVQRGRHLARHLTDLCKETETGAVILHVSGYGYQKRGAPLWLLNGMRTWRRANRNIRLLGIFHELFATGRVWQSSFWLSRAQSYVTRELWRLCDGGVATNHAYFEQLAAWRPNMRGQLKVMPVFSNVGEPKVVVPPAHRSNYMAVFGRPGTEHWVYYGPDSQNSAILAQKLNVEKIIDIGLRDSAPPTSLGKTPVSCLGRLPGSAVSHHLLNCRFGLINYDVPRLGKSSVFAAYAAHGVIPVCIQADCRPNNDLKQGQHFLQWPLEEVPADLSEIQMNLRNWYQEHSTASQAELISDWCLLPKCPEAT